MKWTTARTLTLGATGKSVDGSANVSWTLAEMGAADDTAVLKLTGAQTVAGVKTFAFAQQPRRGLHANSCACAQRHADFRLLGPATRPEPGDHDGQHHQHRIEQRRCRPDGADSLSAGRDGRANRGRAQRWRKVDGSVNTAANCVTWLILTYCARRALGR